MLISDDRPAVLSGLSDMLGPLHPASAVIIVGSLADVELLAAAYTGGARGLLFGDPDHGHR